VIEEAGVPDREDGRRTQREGRVDFFKQCVHRSTSGAPAVNMTEVAASLDLASARDSGPSVPPCYPHRAGRHLYSSVGAPSTPSRRCCSPTMPPSSTPPPFLRGLCSPTCL
jgi:hypothetical protein